jgi:hypothetical protein
VFADEDEKVIENFNSDIYIINDIKNGLILNKYYLNSALNKDLNLIPLFPCFGVGVSSRVRTY